ncbi:uncharacterized protein LOC105384132 [Plutella xylostella]|uniref:uncharacterized protein LOC105384132 n=1 Tax=Plutella xylostella TaxID=51655 RepID=UPI002032F91E|nr:uncharacterized protein LOC105384132 [Plutella xylostella]
MTSVFAQGMGNDQLAEYGRPVESIMRCEDFKSNFARRLSNRYITRSPVASPKKEGPKPTDTLKKPEPAEKILERIEPCSQLSKGNKSEQSTKVALPAAIPIPKADFPTPKVDETNPAEVTALNMEVETLKWQLAQTETNRQMHLALLKQIVSFLNRVKEHMEYQNPQESPKKEILCSRSPRSFNSVDLPRSRSVLHFNKNTEYSLSPAKNMNSKKISKSITNVNGFQEVNSIWNQSKISLVPDTETTKIITEEISRLITLANTVLSTKLPDLTCLYKDVNTGGNNGKITQIDLINDLNKTSSKNDVNESLIDLMEEEVSKSLGLNVSNDSQHINIVRSNGLDVTDNNSKRSKSPSLYSVNIDDFEDNPAEKNSNMGSSKNLNDCALPNNTLTKSRQNNTGDFHRSSIFIEDESGFSSMSSFQEIGIPIINIIPPTPCKDGGFTEGDIIGDTGGWNNGPLEIDKQAMKVFWV